MFPKGVQLVGKKMVLTPTEYRNEKLVVIGMWKTQNYTVLIVRYLYFFGFCFWVKLAEEAKEISVNGAQVGLWQFCS